MTQKFTVRFWGVRGSIPCPGPATARFGGNTACVEVRCGDRLIICDGGTGIRALGDELMRSGAALDADILLSHCHIDHVGGLPFFAPFYSPAHRFRLWAGHLLPALTLEDALRSLMSHPLFPIEAEVFQADIGYRDFRAGESIDLRGGIKVRTAPLDHPGGATGYRIDFAGRSLAYLTDNEIRPGGPEPALVALARGVDLAIYDCAYTDEEIGAKAGWGHSSWRQGLALADAAGIGAFCLFHHAPEHDDACMTRIAAQAQAARTRTMTAAEGDVIEL
ncbi:MAG: MBL fold metallo-hydrolase [Pseudorhodoplanes sp.]|nr:MBL fold metallo-hydrolase [Pseudorhodoplanes sp.]